MCRRLARSCRDVIAGQRRRQLEHQLLTRPRLRYCVQVDALELARARTASAGPLFGSDAFISTSGGIFIGSSINGGDPVPVHRDPVADRLL